MRRLLSCILILALTLLMFASCEKNPPNISVDDNKIFNVNEYVCDSVDDLVILPRCAAGSIAIVLEENNSAVYMKNSQGEWVKL